MQQNPIQPTSQYDDEIDLFELFENLWQQKWLIISTSLLVPFFAYVFTLFTPVKADYYQGSVMVEVATVQFHDINSQNPVSPIESVNDLVQIIPKLTSISSSVPIGAQKIIELSATDSTKEMVEKNLQQATDMIKARHQEMISKLNNIDVIQETLVIGQPSIQLKPPKDKLKLVLAVAFVLGGMLGVFIALIRSAIKKRREKMTN